MLVLAPSCAGSGRTPDAPSDTTDDHVPPLERALGPAAELLEVSAVSVPGVSWRLRRTSSGEVLASHASAHLDTDVLPGSVAKVVTALAALEQGQGDLQMVCPRRLSLHGRTLDCVHPARARPFGLEDALAHSCNAYFARLGAGLDVGRWQRLATRLGVPVGASTAPVPPALMALGLEGPTASAETWRRVVLRALTTEDIYLAHRRRVRQGLARAVTDGTAAALADDWTETLAKTGTVAEAQGSEGLAVVLRPDDDLDLVVRVRGAAGRDAAAVAADVFAMHDARVPVLRVGLRAADATVTPAVLRLEEYVARVVAAEATTDTPAAVLDAVAIAARTYAVAHRGRHDADGFDLCDTTHCQVLARMPWTAARDAARATTTLVLTSDGRVRPVFYSAACAGHLHDAATVWPGEDERSGGLTLPEPHPHAVPAWQSDVDAVRLTTLLREAGFRGDVLRALVVDTEGSDGHPVSVRMDGLVPARVTPDRFRTIIGRGLGWDVLKSHDWQVTRTASGFRFAGRGKGHGVGLCLAGAISMVAGQPDARARDILDDYYPDRQVTSLADEVRLRVSSASQETAPQRLRELRVDLADLRRALKTASARTIEVVEHPTIEAYQRATGRAWWTGGSTRLPTPTTARIEVPPLTVLERSGNARTRLRHELVHALTGTALGDAPLWAQEGLAVHFAASAPRALADLAGGCPSDDEMSGPGSAEAMRAVYARAGACVARALAAGASWRELR